MFDLGRRPCQRSGYGLPHARYFIARIPGPDRYWNVTLLDAPGHRVPFHSY